MESRFGIKDFFLFCLLLLVIVVIVLAMIQYDRQWDVVRQIQDVQKQQTTDLARIRRLLEQGAVVSANPAGPTTNVSMDAGFERILQSQNAPDYAQGGQLVMINQATAAKVTPLIASDQFTFDLWGYVMDTLAKRDPDTLAWQPSLAKSWKISDDSLTIDFVLQHGITFSDGSPLTADDVVYTFNLLRDPKIEDPIMKVGSERLDTIEKTGDYSVRFKFKEPYYGSFELVSGTPIMSKAFYSHYSATEFNRSTGLLIGSGPYRLPDPTSWRPQPGQPLILVRNERYWGPTPSFDRMVWNTIEEPAARVTAFRNGDVDFFGGEDGPPTPEQFVQMCADPQLVARTQHWNLDTPIEGWYYLGWNEKHGRGGAPTAFADARVRRAMTLMTDRTAIMRDIMHGYGSIITGPFPPSTPANDPSIKPWPYDPQAAQQLLADAGYHKQGDRLVGPDGQPFTFKLMFNSNSEPRRRIASFLHDAYAKVGIDAEPESAEWSVFLQRLDDRQYDAVVGAWGGSLESDPYELFDSSQQAATGENFIQFSNPQVDQLINKGRSIVDDSRRMPVWHQLCQVLHEQEPYTFMFIYQELDFAHNRLHGLRPTTALGINPTGEWYIPKNLQVSP